MKFLSIIILSVFIFILPGCDPAKTLTLKVSKKGNASIYLYGHQSVLPIWNQQGAGKIIIKVSANDTTKQSFYYELGGWSNEGIAKLASNIDSIVFYNGVNRRILKTKPELESYFKKHRGGYLNSVLKIKAK